MSRSVPTFGQKLRCEVPASISCCRRRCYRFPESFTIGCSRASFWLALHRNNATTAPIIVDDECPVEARYLAITTTSTRQSLPVEEDDQTSDPAGMLESVSTSASGGASDSGRSDSRDNTVPTTPSTASSRGDGGVRGREGVSQALSRADSSLGEGKISSIDQPAIGYGSCRDARVLMSWRSMCWPSLLCFVMQFLWSIPSRRAAEAVFVTYKVMLSPE